MKKIDFKKLIICIAIPLLVGGIGVLLGRADERFELLTKPWFMPPNILFPIVWSVLYILMGVGVYLVLINNNEKENMKNTALIYYGISLVINALYNLFFFRLEWLLFSSIWILILFVFVVMYTSKFEKINKIAAYIQIPYFIWLTVAFLLNYSIYLLN